VETRGGGVVGAAVGLGGRDSVGGCVGGGSFVCDGSLVDVLGDGG